MTTTAGEWDWPELTAVLTAWRRRRDRLRITLLQHRAIFAENAGIDFEVWFELVEPAER